MVNYPTILGLESRVKALENKPKPTPTQSGNVTVTCVDSEETPLEFAYGGLNIDSDTPIAGGNTGSDGTVTPQ